MSQQLVIAAGQSASGAIKVGSAKLLSFATADAWAAADLSLESGEAKDGPWFPICKDEAGNPLYLIPFAQNKRVALDKNAMAAAAIDQYLRVVSKTAGTGAAAVNQPTQVTINVDIKP